MMAESADFWLWAATVATAMIGGGLSLWGTARERSERARGIHGGVGYRLVMASYVAMSASIGFFIIRGLI